MQAHLRLTRTGVRSSLRVPQRRNLATPPTTPPSGIPPVPPPTTASPLGAQPVRPVVVTNIPPTTSLPPPRPPRNYFRRFLIYTTLGVLTFYPLSGYISTKSDAYRDFFTNNIPLGETIVDYADDNGWETFGYGSIQKSALNAWHYISGDKSASTSKSEEVKRDVERRVNQLKKEADRTASDVSAKAKDVKADAKSRAQEAKAAVNRTADKAKAETKSLISDAKSTAAGVKEQAAALTSSAVEKTKALASDAVEKVSEVTDHLPFNFSEGVEGIVREAEKALGKAERKASDVVTKVTAADSHTPREYVDTAKPRKLSPETVDKSKPSFAGKEVYKGELPLGFEPPPGYYIPPPPKDAPKPAPSPLPLLAPKVKDFASSEPIIAQLASTIDSLTTSLAPVNSPSLAGPDARGILTRAQDDLTALSDRLEKAKKDEQSRLEKTVQDKTAEFETTLKEMQAKRESEEQGLKSGWQKEREMMVSEWRSALENELENQRVGIEKRLREEVISQGIELQRRWLRSIKSQVETERGGRLAKLDTLTTSLKQLERITLDNSASLDDNVQLHKIWSALRAAQTKAEQGDLAFDEEIRVLKTVSSPKDAPKETLLSETLGQLDASGIPASGIKSLSALSSWFTTSVAPRIHSASTLPPPEETTVLSHLASLTLSKVMFRPQPGLVQGDTVDAVLSRAEYCLSHKDLDGAAREVNSLRGWPKKLAEDWLSEARKTLEVQQVLDLVATEATAKSLLLV